MSEINKNTKVKNILQKALKLIDNDHILQSSLKKQDALAGRFFMVRADIIRAIDVINGVDNG